MGFRRWGEEEGYGFAPSENGSSAIYTSLHPHCTVCHHHPLKIFSRDDSSLPACPIGLGAAFCSHSAMRKMHLIELLAPFEMQTDAMRATLKSLMKWNAILQGREFSMMNINSIEVISIKIFVSKERTNSKRSGYDCVIWIPRRRVHYPCYEIIVIVLWPPWHCMLDAHCLSIGVRYEGQEWCSALDSVLHLRKQYPFGIR